MPPRTILRASALPSPSLVFKPSLAPRLLARSARHAEDEARLLSSLPLVPRRPIEGAPHGSLREAVCGPSLLLLAMSALSNAPKQREDPLPLSLTLVTATPASVHVRLCLNARRCAPGPLELALEIENCASHPVALSFGSGQSFDFTITKVGEVVPFWRWASGRRFAPQLRALRLDSGSVLRFEAVWPDAPQGVWGIEGKVTANGGFSAERVEVEVGD